MTVGISHVEAEHIIRLADLYAVQSGDLAVYREYLVDEGLTDDGRRDADHVEFQDAAAGSRKALVEYLRALLTPQTSGTPTHDHAEDHDEDQERPVHEPLPLVPGLPNTPPASSSHLPHHCTECGAPTWQAADHTCRQCIEHCKLAAYRRVTTGAR